MHLVKFPPGLWWAALWSTASSVMIFFAAFTGIKQHAMPRIFAGVALLIIAVSYWIDIFDWFQPWTTEVRRGAGFILWPSLFFTAWSGRKYGRSLEALMEKNG